jgi:cytochrome b6-f complex iron-sulfur subunit
VNNPVPEPTRRGFLWKVWLLLGGVALAEAAWIVTDFIKPRRKWKTADEGGSVVVAGPVERFEPGSVTAFPEGRFYLARLDDGGFIALHRECTHLGCTVPWIDDENRFVCPCHASSFDITGDVLSPPAPRPLDIFPVRIENDIVKVDIRKTVRRQSFSASQVVRS